MRQRKPAGAMTVLLDISSVQCVRERLPLKALADRTSPRHEATPDRSCCMPDELIDQVIEEASAASDRTWLAVRQAEHVAAVRWIWHALNKQMVRDDAD